MASGQKTEKPTQRRLNNAREEGQFPVSRDFLSGTQFLLFVFLLSCYGLWWFDQIRASTRTLLDAAFDRTLTIASTVDLIRNVVLEQFATLAWVGGSLVVSAFAAQMITSNFGFANRRLAPDLARFSPVSRLRQMWRQNLNALVQALILLPLFFYVVQLVLRERFHEFVALSLGSVEAAASWLGASLTDLLWRAAGVFFVFGCVDLYRQRRKHISDLRMTKQEIREEHKEVEGNPQVKAHIRRLQRERMRRSMLKAVPQATAVVVNPVHYAVAIRYEAAGLGAPTVVAKGKNLIARRIREIAEEHKIPVVENVPLAQALYKSVKVGHEIPAELYRAVAEILAYIYRLMNGRLPGQK